MLIKIIISIIFFLAILLFYFARKLARENERTFIVLKISGAAAAITCVILAAVI